MWGAPSAGTSLPRPRVAPTRPPCPRELAAQTLVFFRYGAALSEAAGGPGASASSGRKARVFKLGDFQIKQLRNGDVYKVGPSGGGERKGWGAWERKGQRSSGACAAACIPGRRPCRSS